LDVAGSKDGTVIVAELGHLFISKDGGPYVKDTDMLPLESQNIETFGSNSFGATGQFKITAKLNCNGVATSPDGGASWAYSDIGIPLTARYASFPSASTWYVASGSWDSPAPNGTAPALPSSRPPNTDTFRSLTRRISLAHDGKRWVRQMDFDSKLTQVGVLDCPGAISKSTDGGRTWKKVFDTGYEMYFNDIDCFDANTCVAAAENGDASYGLMTSDGGASWTKVVDGPSSLMGARMLSASEAWLSGGASDRGSGYTGYFYHTVDGGNTWDLEKVHGISTDLSFSNGIGYTTSTTQVDSWISIYN